MWFPFWWLSLRIGIRTVNFMEAFSRLGPCLCRHAFYIIMNTALNKKQSMYCFEPHCFACFSALAVPASITPSCTGFPCLWGVGQLAGGIRCYFLIFVLLQSFWRISAWTSLDPPVPKSISVKQRVKHSSAVIPLISSIRFNFPWRFNLTEKINVYAPRRIVENK